MKYILIIGDGMADNPVPVLQDKTPLEYLACPAIDALASAGEVGNVKNCPDGLPPGSDTAILSIFGCDPNVCYTGRAPLEAAAQGIALRPGDAAYRCNMVSLTETDGIPFAAQTILSHSAGSIDGAESDELVAALFADPEFARLAERAGMRVYPAHSFRHMAVQSGASIDGVTLAPPHNYLGSAITDILPQGANPNAAVLSELMSASYAFLSRHPVNLKRRADGKLPANCVWFWAEGTAVELPDFTAKYGRTGGVISAVPLCHGIASLTGLDRVFVDGATGELDTNYEGKVSACVETLKTRDFAAIHVEAPDECTHNGDLPGKLEAIRRLDSRVVAPLVGRLRADGTDFRLLLLSDHKTLTSTRGHDGDPVPYLLYDSRRDNKTGKKYTETDGEAGAAVPEGTALMGMLFDA
ncbi:MAG: 2,3-bisphosphoglycerate-independent phosphoglycerate mutase [Oscillospiraceae bacterium]|jgi:2,3-bisphosphoglycerate-independent phosphoglycerate mutase|nr:2,3-bisphosphoglycerate-independent phosphoglycerate mutase [Oscillospiraceae bacterium]